MKKKKSKKKKNQGNEAQPENKEEDLATNQGTERNYQTDRGMMSTTGDQPEKVADIEAQNRPASKKRGLKVCSISVLLLLAAALLVSVGVGIGFMFAMTKTAKPSSNLQQTMKNVASTAADNVSDNYEYRPQITYPVIVEEPKLTEQGQTSLVEWKTRTNEHHEATFEDFRV